MTGYIDIDDFKQRVGITTSDKDVRIVEHIAAATRRVETITHRTFALPGSATARYFTPTSCDLVSINDATTITSVAVDDADAGTYTTTWAATDYETDPANGVGPDGQTGWPITSLRAVASRTFPMWNRRRPIKVTATWGWAAIPDDVIEATYLLANRLFYEVSVPGGTTAPNIEFGLPGSALRRQYTVEDLLEPYARTDKTIGVAG